MTAIPDKTITSWIERGFEFLSYLFIPEGLTMATRTIEQFVERALRLYEREPRELGGSSRLGMYVRRWVCWTGAGLQDTFLCRSAAMVVRTPTFT